MLRLPRDIRSLTFPDRRCQKTLAPPTLPSFRPPSGKKPGLRFPHHDCVQRTVSLALPPTFAQACHTSLLFHWTNAMLYTPLRALRPTRHPTLPPFFLAAGFFANPFPWTDLHPFLPATATFFSGPHRLSWADYFFAIWYCPPHKPVLCPFLLGFAPPLRRVCYVFPFQTPPSPPFGRSHLSGIDPPFLLHLHLESAELAKFTHS